MVVYSYEVECLALKSLAPPKKDLSIKLVLKARLRNISSKQWRIIRRKEIHVQKAQIASGSWKAHRFRTKVFKDCKILLDNYLRIEL